MSNKDNEPIVTDNSKIIKVKIENELKTSFISYAMAVNVSRAIPDVRDGLKPVHRRILYAMGELNLFADKSYRKCARIVGDVLGKYHPHGDAAVYSALVRLAQDFSIRCPLVDGHGNFGSVDGDPPAAQRYTEAKLTKISSEMLRDIDKDTVDWYPNFDDTLMQPAVLPARFPNLLVNGSDGIAVGMATNIPPHNLGEVIDAVDALIDNPEITNEELMKYVPGPDYPTGGILMGRSGLKRAYMTGKGSFVLRAKTEIEEDENGRQHIIITELPYQVNKEELIKTIADHVKNKRIEGISDIREESDMQVRVVITVKRDAQASVVQNLLFKHTNLQVSGGITFLALVKGEPKILSLKEMLYHYLEHQKEVITRRTKFDLEKAKERAHIVEGLIIALANIDEVVAVIKASSDKVDAANNLMSKFLLSDKQANAILEMRLQRLTSMEVEALKNEMDALHAQIQDLTEILETPQRVLDIVKTELNEIKEKYDTPRKTEIRDLEDEIDIGDLIEREDVVISRTHFGYVKRLPVSEYKAQHRGGRGITAHRPKDEDFVEDMFITNTHNDLLCFTNFGKVYAIKAYEIPEAERNARGRAIINILQLSGEEKVNAIIPMTENNEGFLIMATKKGLIKKTVLEEFQSIRKVGKIAISLNDGDELVSVSLINRGQEVIMASAQGKCIRFADRDVRPMGRNAAGVRSIKLSEDDFVVDMLVLKEGYKVLTVTQNGFGKRCEADEYRLQSRAGKGVKATQLSEKTGNLVNLKLVSDDDDVMIIADNGIIIRMHASEIPVISRDTRGVRLMSLVGDGKVVCVAITAREQEDDNTENETNSAE